ncbi:substrate-binding domain-containing protein [Streptomyces sp. NPDC002588]|uniref:sugar ABC transporter substrate-binding protein n=1 Tax=Streptomyces sp. NPDC002588 TaxID=3154419 RepID=UPI00331D079D
MRRIAIAVVASTMSLSLAGCGMFGASGDSSSATPTRSNDITIGVLMPEATNTRYAEFDYPYIKSTVASLTSNKGKTEYANAKGKTKTQNIQMQKMIDEKVDCIVLDAVDSKAIVPMVKKAKEAGIPVIAYDRLAEGPIDAYVSFDNELVGEVQGRSITEALGSASTADKIVMINGSPTDPNAAQFKAGALNELKGRVTISADYDTDAWDPKIAQQHMADALAKLGKNNIAAVYSANDAMAGGAIKAMKAAGMSDSDLPPITGQDAELPAVQRIVTGEQYMTVYKPYPTLGQTAAEAAVAKVQGRELQFEALTRDKVDSATQKDIPAKLVTVVALTKTNIKTTIIADGIYKVSQICTPAYQAACDAIKLK